MKVLDLFSGIGGFSLGLEAAGMQTVAFCEVDKFCREVLKKRWPGIPIYEDIRSLTGEQIEQEIGAIDVICGGFPCQDISQAGFGAGLQGERSGLFWEAIRITSEVRPRPQFIILENVTNLLRGGRGKWFGDVLAGLAEIGLDAEWHCIRTSRYGLPSNRDRTWIIAYPNGAKLESLDLSESFLINPKESCRRELTRAVSKGLSFDDYRRIERSSSRVAAEMDRLRAVGNSASRHIVEQIGRAIMDINKEVEG